MRATSLCLFFAGALAIVASPALGWAGDGGTEPGTGGSGGAGSSGTGRTGSAEALCDGGVVAEDGGPAVCPSATPDFLSCAERPGGGASGAGAGLVLLGAAVACVRRRRRQ